MPRRRAATQLFKDYQKIMIENFVLLKHAYCDTISSDRHTMKKGDDFMPKSIAIRIDDELKRQAETTLDELGLNMTTYVISSLKALVREQGVPFELTTKQRVNEQYQSKLDDAFEDLVSNGGFEYLGKNTDGTAKFGDKPVKASL